jgi:hypothetical protein
MARTKKTEQEDIYVNEQAKEYFERNFPHKYKVSISTALWKRTNKRNNTVSYYDSSTKVAPPVSDEFIYDPICKGGKDGADIFNGADAQNFAAEKQYFLNKVNQAYAE